jgi:hypothetical protein
VLIGAVEAYSGAMEAYYGAMEAHFLALEAMPGEPVRLNPEVWRFRIQLVIMEAHPRAMESSSRTIAADS